MAVDDATQAKTEETDKAMLDMLSGTSSPDEPGDGGGDAPTPGSGKLKDPVPSAEDSEPTETPNGTDDDEAEELPTEDSDIEDLGDYAAELGLDSDAVKNRAKLLGAEAVRKGLDEERARLMAAQNKPADSATDAAKTVDLSKHLEALASEDKRAAFLDNNPDAEWLLDGVAALKAEIEALKGETTTAKGMLEQMTAAQQRRVVSDVEKFYDNLWKSGDKRFGPARALKLSPESQAARQELASYGEFLMKSKGMDHNDALAASLARMPQKQKAQAEKPIPTALRGVPGRDGKVVAHRKAAAQTQSEKNVDRAILAALGGIKELR